MSNRRVIGKALIAFLAVAVCLPLSIAYAEPVPVFQNAEVHTFPAGSDTTSGGTLLRKKNGVWARLALHGFDADSAYTVWWVIFNDPDGCAGGPGACTGPGDFGTADASILNAAGFVTGASGNANITAHLEARTPAAGLQVDFGNGLRPGNGYGAEVHMLFLNHGPVEFLEGEVSQHISFTEGGAPQFGIGFPPAD